MSATKVAFLLCATFGLAHGADRKQLMRRHAPKSMVFTPNGQLNTEQDSSRVDSLSEVSDGVGAEEYGQQGKAAILSEDTQPALAVDPPALLEDSQPSTATCGSCVGCLLNGQCRSMSSVPTPTPQRCANNTGTWCVAASRENFMSITCPFLSSMINEGILEVKASYSKDELNMLMAHAGLGSGTLFTPPDWIAVADDNFAPFAPGFQMDIFNMDGATNEHRTSTGICDCASTYTNCTSAVTPFSCKRVSTVPCALPNAAKFEQFWTNLVKTSDDRADFRTAFRNIGLLYKGSSGLQIDTCPIGIGSITGAYTNIFKVFGTNGIISKADLRSIVIDRRFPTAYKAMITQ